MCWQPICRVSYLPSHGDVDRQWQHLLSLLTQDTLELYASNRVVTLPVLPPTVSTKDLIETCCAAGQQWAIDNDECLEVPESGTEDDVCR